MWLQHALTDLSLSTRGEKEDECFEVGKTTGEFKDKRCDGSLGGYGWLRTDSCGSQVMGRQG